MKRRTLCLLLCLGLLRQPLFAQTAPDPEVAKGIREVEEGDIDAGILTLDAAARRLARDPSRAHILAQAYLYLGIAYLGKGQQALAKVQFREAVTRAPELSLSPDQYPPKVVELFEAAKRDVVASAPSPAAAAPPKKGGSKTPLILGGIAVVGGAGVLAARGGGGGSATATAAPPNYRVDASDNQPLPSHGGSGGTSYQMSCPTGSLMVGITGRSDTNVVLRLGAYCAILASDGSLTGELSLSAVGGTSTSTGGQAFDDHCPTGQVVFSVFGSQGLAPINVVAIRSLGIGCAPVREWVASGTRGQMFSPHGRTSDPTSTSFTDECSMGYAVTSFAGATSTPGPNIIERLATTCTRIRP